jgi:hypothetical protein
MCRPLGREFVPTTLLSGNRVCGRTIVHAFARNVTGKFDIRFQHKTGLSVAQSVFRSLAFDFLETAIREFVQRINCPLSEEF